MSFTYFFKIAKEAKVKCYKFKVVLRNAWKKNADFQKSTRDLLEKKTRIQSIQKFYFAIKSDTHYRGWKLFISKRVVWLLWK